MTKNPEVGITDASGKITDTVMRAGMELLAKTKEREQHLGNLMCTLTLYAARNMHNSPPENIVAYINKQLRVAGFDVTVREI